MNGDTENTARIRKISEKIVRIPPFTSFAAIGDPGCEGLGAYNLNVYAGALKESAKDDFAVVLGDLVPTGTRHFYDIFRSVTETVAEKDVYVLRGNHDTGEYPQYFGRSNYAVLSGNTAIIALDNAARVFAEEGLSLVREVLAMGQVEQAVIAFHIPAPNRITGNSVSEEEFSRLKAAYSDHKGKVKYLLCGHIHSRFTDVTDGIPLLCTGGGGAFLEDASETIRACGVPHHIIRFQTERGKLGYRFADLADGGISERGDEILRKQLQSAVTDELTAFLKYRVFAERLRAQGKNALANAFGALAHSEWVHAKNFYSLMQPSEDFGRTLASLAAGEKFEYGMLYKMMEEYAANARFPLAQRAYAAAAEAEKVHARILAQAADFRHFTEEKIYVCPVCGFVMTDKTLSDLCPVCGSSGRQFAQYTVGGTQEEEERGE